MPAFAPRFTITHAITAGRTTIERARGFMDAAKLSQAWLERMSKQALLLEAHHTTHIEGTQLTLAQSERLWSGEVVAEARADDVRELLNYRGAFELVSDYLGSGEPITEGLVREIHKRLVTGVRGGAAQPGRYRFKRLFTLSEFYDRDRSAFYRAIQSVREQDLDLTRWLAFFVEGLSTQMDEVKQRGELVIGET